MLWATQLIRISLKYASLTGKAFESDGGLHGVRVTRCYLDRPQQSPKLKWEGVISINNVKHRDHGMGVWRAYGIGKEKFVSRSDLENLENFSLPHLTVVKDALHPKQCFSPTKERKTTKRSNAASNQGLELKESDVEDHDNHVDLFPCPEEGSIRRYQGHSSLQSHLGVSRHKYALERETLQDQYAQNSSVESEYLESTVQEHLVLFLLHHKDGH